jgi:hypothetical protein
MPKKAKPTRKPVTIVEAMTDPTLLGAAPR